MTSPTRVIVLDTETSGFIPRNSLGTDFPEVIQLAYLVIANLDCEFVCEQRSIVIACDHPIPQAAIDVHGITTANSQRFGIPYADAISQFLIDATGVHMLVGHNIAFDLTALLGDVAQRAPSMFNRLRALINKSIIFDTMHVATPLCKLPGSFNKYKWPKLSELYQHLFQMQFKNAHDALADVQATADCFFKLWRSGTIEGTRIYRIPLGAIALATHNLTAHDNSADRVVTVGVLSFDS